MSGSDAIADPADPRPGSADPRPRPVAGVDAEPVAAPPASALDRWRSGLVDGGGERRDAGLLTALVGRWRNRPAVAAREGAEGADGVDWPGTGWSVRLVVLVVAVAGAVLLVAFAASRLVAGTSPGPAAVVAAPAGRTTGTAAADPDTAGTVGPVATGAPPAVVAVAGAVGAPGVYRLAVGARVADLLAVAGGPAADADVDRLNLAAVLHDGDRVYVPRRGEADPPSVVDPEGGGGGTDADGGSAGATSTRPVPIDVNRATVEQLDGLPGVGPSTAAAIVQYRSEHGPFRTVDDLGNVRGIGPAKLAQLRPLVRL